MYYFFKFFSGTTNFGEGPGYLSWYTDTSFRKLFRRENWILFYSHLRMYNGLARTSKQARVLIKCVTSRSSNNSCNDKDSTQNYRKYLKMKWQQESEQVLEWWWLSSQNYKSFEERNFFLFYFCQNISSSLKKSEDFWKSFTLRWFFKISTRISFS